MTRRDATANPRTTLAAVVLVVEAGLAVLGVWFHYGMTAMYGDITDVAAGWGARVSSAADFGGPAVLLVVGAAVIAVLVTAQRWARFTAVIIPVLMVGALTAVTPVALREKLVSQYDDTPQCVSAESGVTGPGSVAERESQRAFELVRHVGHFSGGGGSGVGGCDRQLLLTEEVDVLRHYRAALPDAGWRVVEDDARGLRAERDGMAFEVVVCGRGGVVWAGTTDLGGGARCRPEYG
ncbi:MAG: hypothetical protein AVDCRST_MAG07-3253 [uncultured Frankineae bacterium]|uniref:Uncharacterized protein n=1 Tax=uncultured Frankineae bacterium TaxID=437475 RepID=A0A6J4MAD1_9ACTN|nr:MAG: hypothetical protein AVDCRST_MAG07-3253 [uncultured Frankineae bacterium]